MKKKISLVCIIMIFCFVFSGIAKQDPLILVESKISRVVDGDTIWVEGVPESIRLLCIDTEESEKGKGAEDRTAAIAKRFPEYVKEQTRNNPYPKFNTPMGWEGTLFAEKFCPVGTPVRVEYDELGRTIDYYGRALGYIIVLKDGKWVNYNVECVRAGMSPYSDKYGPSKRFEYEFIEAEREARINHRGVWSDNTMHYPDYDGRLKWWHIRGMAIKVFDAKYHSKMSNAIEVLNDIDWDKLSNMIGKEVLLFGSASFTSSNGTPVMEMHHNNNIPLDVKFTNEKYYNSISSDLNKYHDDMVYFRGTLEKGSGNAPYSISIQSTGQFFVDIPGINESEVPVVEIKTSQPVIEEKPKTVTPKAKSSTKVVGDAIPWQDATTHMNEEVIITGKIGRTNNIGNLTFLNFDRSKVGELTLVVFKENYSKFPEPPDGLYKNKTIKVKGKVIEYKGKPEIVITSPEQIEVIE